MRSLVHDAHGTAADGGGVLVVEATRLKDMQPVNADRTAEGFAIKKRRGRPFERDNKAAAGRGPTLTRITIDPDAPEERRRVHRKAQTLCNKRRRELEAQYGVESASSAVRVELVAWARATAWADFFDRGGDAVKAAALAKKASEHQLKAIGILEREAEAYRRKHPKTSAPWTRKASS